MEFSKLSIEHYNELLGAKVSTPGGGSALAITLSLACSLCNMVINFTIDKKGYEGLKDKLEEYKKQVDIVLKKAYFLSDEDARVYSELMSAYRSKDPELIEKCSIDASLVPYNIYLSAEVIQNIADDLYLCANKNIISDAKIASNLCYSIYPGCVATIKANVNSIHDEEVLAKLKSVIE